MVNCSIVLRVTMKQHQSCTGRAILKFIKNNIVIMTHQMLYNSLTNFLRYNCLKSFVTNVMHLFTVLHDPDYAKWRYSSQIIQKNHFPAPTTIDPRSQLYLYRGQCCDVNSQQPAIILLFPIVLSSILDIHPHASNFFLFASVWMMCNSCFETLSSQGR